MHCRSLAVLNALLVALPLSAAHANGASAEFRAGGLEFKPEPDISMAREDLTLSANAVHVHYVFVSKAAKPRALTIAFPMPKVPQDDSPDSLASVSEQNDADNPRNYMAFKVTVDGKPVSPKLHEYAWNGDKNVTQDFRKLSIPLYASSDDAPQTLGKLPQKSIHYLEMQHLVEADDNWLIPKWDFQSVYEWSQTFAPGKTEVDVTYSPILGHPAYMDPRSISDAYMKTYCVSEEFEKKHAARTDELGEVATLGYILKTANYWNGPIGDFHLKVDEGTGSIASLCVPEGFKATDKPLEWTAKDFVPKNDLKVLFLVP